jgi:glycosyltransferase involved in cell wall biosynthesis
MRFTEGGVEYFNIPQHRVMETYNFMRGFRESRYLREAAGLIESWKPDLIHVHGTERFFGLVRARKLVQIPTVVSMQTIMAEYARLSWGEMTWRDVLLNTTFWEIARNATLPADYHRLKRKARDETDILCGVDGVLGRTEWDRAHVRQINPQVPYFHIDEIMRPEFRTAEPWSLQSARRGHLIATSSPGPSKGVSVLLRAVHALRSWGHDVRLKVAGISPSAGRSASDRYLFKLVDDLGLRDAIEFLGWCDGQTLVSHQLQSHCFVTPSIIENGCNGLSEAQLVGLPCVASHTGGMTTTVCDNESGLLFSSGDAAMLATRIETILKNDALAEQLGAAARIEAQRRHDPSRIVDDLLSAYNQVAKTRPSGA